MSDNYEILYDRKSECCDALITEAGFCTFCWEHAE